MFCQMTMFQWDEEDDSESGDEENWGDDEEELDLKTTSGERRKK